MLEPWLQPRSFLLIPGNFIPPPAVNPHRNAGGVRSFSSEWSSLLPASIDVCLTTNTHPTPCQHPDKGVPRNSTTVTATRMSFCCFARYRALIGLLHTCHKLTWQTPPSPVDKPWSPSWASRVSLGSLTMGGTLDSKPGSPKPQKPRLLTTSTHCPRPV